MEKYNNTEIALVGPYPKPYGGISLHIKRLKERLEKNGVVCTVYDNSGVKKEEDNVVSIKSGKILLLTRLLHIKGNIIHLHTYNSKLIGLLSLFALIKKKTVIVTHHGFRYSPDRFNFWYKLVFWLAAKAKIHFIVVGPEIREKMICLNINSGNIEVIHSFIPPLIREEEITEIPQDIWDFINHHTPVISANGFMISFYKGEDLYGIDMCVDLCAELKSQHPRVGFIFCIPVIGDYNYFHKMKRKIVERGIENDFLFVAQPCQFYPILMKSHIFVRPTNVDGYGVSIAEAIYLNVPAVASDVCTRPEGVILFKNRDLRDFILKVKDVLDNYQWHRKRIEVVEIEDNFEKIMNIYRRLGIKKEQTVKN
jgi:glycosyltransferase involved in cell wall biosynthesis